MRYSILNLPRLRSRRIHPIPTACLGLLLCLTTTLSAAEVRQRIGVKPGMQFDVVRFAVEPGDRVIIDFVNPDEMAHNLLVTRPGRRMAVVSAALALGVDGLAKEFVPDSPDVLLASRLLTPDQEQTLIFNAPDEPGIYPYVCTFPGHGMLMYGAIYVGVPMPALESDENVPPVARKSGETESKRSFHAWGDKRPLMYRLFMPDAGPAAIAVALPNQQSYCWDAGPCRLRYAWSGDFLDPWPVWRGNGHGLADIQGDIYWRDDEQHPLRIGRGRAEPTVEFLGYRKVADHPEFLYTVNGVEVRELIQALHHGDGLNRRFTIAPTAEPVVFRPATNDEVVFTHDGSPVDPAGLRVDAANGAEFEIIMTRKPEHGGVQ